MSDKEMVLDIGVEGGRATFFRTPIDYDRGEFYVKGGSLDLDENDDDYWRTWEFGPYQCIEGALSSISDNGDWVFFYPVSIHPEFRAKIWDLVHEAVQTQPDERKRDWDEWGRADWQERCQPEP